MSGTVDRLSQAQIRRALTILDANRNQRIEAPEANIYPAHVRAIGSLSDDYVDIGRTVRAMAAGRTRFDVSGDSALAERIAAAFDRNRNGRIDSSEIRFSPEVREALTFDSTEPVTVQDLAEGFYSGLLQLGRKIYEPSEN